MKSVVAILTFLLLGSAAAAQTTREIFDAGETLDYNLHWVRVSGGAARMTIASIENNRCRITSVGKSGAFFSRFFKVRDEIESIVDRDTFSTLQYHKVLDEKGKRKDELTVVDEARGIATRNGKTVKVPRPVFDPLSLIYYIRTLDLSPGRVHEFTVLQDGKIYIVHLSVVQRETLTTPAGTFQTVLVEPKMRSQEGVFRDERRRLLVWYTDDTRHVPVRIRSDLNFGSITATLRAITPGVTSTEPVTSRGQ